MDIKQIASNIEEKLDIERGYLTKLIDEHEKKKGKIIIDDSHTELISKINELLKNDEEIRNFDTKELDPQVSLNFNLLKKNLGKLQILVLLKKFEKSDNTSDILNTFIQILNQKIENVNDIMLNQTGGSNSNNNNLYNLYYKYKYKYLILKYKL